MVQFFQKQEILTGHQALTELYQMHIDEQLIRNVIEFAFGYVTLDVSDNDPKGTSGSMWWQKINRGFKENLCPIGWRAEDRRNLPIFISPDGRIVLVVSSADNAGREDRDKQPSTRHDKGQSLVDLADDPSLYQEELKLEGIPRLVRIAPDHELWILLYEVVDNRDGTTTIYLEISQPGTVIKDRCVDSWKRRIILEPSVLDTQKVMPDRFTKSDELEDEDFEIGRR